MKCRRRRYSPDRRIVRLLVTPSGGVRRSFASRLPSPSIDCERRHQPELVRTLGRGFLDCVGTWNACARRVHVHVNTVRYRIRWIEELAGRNGGPRRLVLALRLWGHPDEWIVYSGRSAAGDHVGHYPYRPRRIGPCRRSIASGGR
ncbi:helix-turn-helix domain-containing protein [Nonomuraea sp. NPDC005650]|uniref:helix-turn-helix domain-containing protein n=1 Tax=Nonomuraea sp. NPDC005650 TaxID=3157045 RepID=UPI0033B64D1D